MITRRLCIAAAVLACTAGTRAADNLPAIAAQVRTRLGNEPVQRGLFEQRKKITGFKNPLVSRGDFLVVRDRGVVWRTREPFASSLVLTRDRLVARQADGSVTSQLSTREEPGLRAINEILFALLSADLDTLAQRFDITGELSGTDDWVLTLTPRDASLARFIARIQLEGDRFVRTATLDEPRGDSSLIRFSQQSTAAAPSAEEAARFD